MKWNKKFFLQSFENIVPLVFGKPVLAPLKEIVHTHTCTHAHPSLVDFQVLFLSGGVKTSAFKWAMCHSHSREQMREIIAENAELMVPKASKDTMRTCRHFPRCAKSQARGAGKISILVFRSVWVFCFVLWNGEVVWGPILRNRPHFVWCFFSSTFISSGNIGQVRLPCRSAVSFSMIIVPTFLGSWRVKWNHDWGLSPVPDAQQGFNTWKLALFYFIVLFYFCLYFLLCLVFSICLSSNLILSFDLFIFYFYEATLNPFWNKVREGKNKYS